MPSTRSKTLKSKNIESNDNNNGKLNSKKQRKSSPPPPDSPKKKQKSIDINYDSDEQQLNTLDDEFCEKCYAYALPFDWKEEYTVTNIDSSQNKKLTRIYNKSKKFLINKAIQLSDILQLINITNDERTRLLEHYAIMQSLDADLYEYIKYRDNLRSEINFYNQRQITYSELLVIEKKKEELCKFNLNNDEIEQKIIKLNIDPYSQAQIYQKFVKLNSMSPMDSEYHKLKEWLDTVIDIPFNIIKPLRENLDNICLSEYYQQNTPNSINSILTYVKHKLDSEIYGMDSIKEELLLILNHRLSNPNASDHSIALIGPPGVGKTKIIRTLASILSLPFEQISMGGVNDSSFLDGHSYTYEGARPGKIIESLKKLGCKNGILFFDEVDKIGTSVRSQEVSNQLLHITDFTQNGNFCDKYLPELPIDLSKLWFIFSLNDENLMDPILKNRMNLIKVSGYNPKDKIQIINKFLIPQITQSLNFFYDIILTDDIKMHIINKCSQEEGIRDLKRAIESLYRKLDVLCKAVLSDGTFGDLKLSFAIKDFKLPYTLQIQDINLLLKNYIKENKINGLYI
jgi:ATP-dependent Lon protease